MISDVCSQKRTLTIKYEHQIENQKNFIIYNILHINYKETLLIKIKSVGKFQQEYMVDAST